jgi:hypothetical protein
MAGETDDQPKGFQVKDRRRFTESGEVREEAGAEDRAEETPKIGTIGAPPPEPQRAPESLGEPTEITISTFLMSLSTQALMYLGEIPNPVTGQPETDLGAVRELIDIISMLQEKTRGNLDPAEAHLFEKVLYDLRMRFVEKARK